MPGAPNRPPESTPAAVVPLPVDGPAARALRRLAPSRVALNLDIWRGTVSPELLGPLDRAEKAFRTADYAACENALDQLAIRFAEPRWPSLPPAFRSLRVSISTPQPPRWDPDFGVTPEERSARKARRDAESQVALVAACYEWAQQRGIDLQGAPPDLAKARAAMTDSAGVAAVYEVVDPAWRVLYDRVPLPSSAQAAGRPAADVEST